VLYQLSYRVWRPRGGIQSQLSRRERALVPSDMLAGAGKASRSIAGAHDLQSTSRDALISSR